MYRHHKGLQNYVLIARFTFFCIFLFSLSCFQAGANEETSVFNPTNLAGVLGHIKVPHYGNKGLAVPTETNQLILNPALVIDALVKIQAVGREGLPVYSENEVPAKIENKSPPEQGRVDGLDQGKGPAGIQLLARSLMLSKEQEELLRSNLLPRFLNKGVQDTSSGGF